MTFRHYACGVCLLKSMFVQAQARSRMQLCCRRWRPEGEGLELVHPHSVSHVTWHARGDYFASVAPAGNTQVIDTANQIASERAILW